MRKKRKAAMPARFPHFFAAFDRSDIFKRYARKNLLTMERFRPKISRSCAACSLLTPLYSSIRRQGLERMEIWTGGKEKKKMTSFYPDNKRILIGIALSLSLFAAAATAQTQPPASTPAADSAAKLQPPKIAATASAPAKEAAMPMVHSVRDVELGMSVDEVKKKLGKPEVQDDTGLYFSLSGGDAVQIGLDENKHVRTVAAIYAAGSKGAPAFKDVFGSSTEDGTGDLYKMQRYPEAGYWVSYSRTNSQDKPVVVVTIKKIS